MYENSPLRVSKVTDLLHVLKSYQEDMVILDNELTRRCNKKMIFTKISNIKLDTLNGIICLHYNNTIIDRLIQYVTHSPFSHVSCIIQHCTHRHMTDISRATFHVESLPKQGVMIHPIIDFRPENGKYSIKSIIQLINNYREVSDISMILIPKKMNERLEQEVKRIMDETIYNPDCKYPPYERHISQFLKFFIPKALRKMCVLPESKDSYFCSELTLDLLHESDIHKLNKRASDFSPGDFFRPFGKTNIYADDILYNKIIRTYYDKPIIIINKNDLTAGLYVLDFESYD